MARWPAVTGSDRGAAQAASAHGNKAATTVTRRIEAAPPDCVRTRARARIAGGVDSRAGTGWPQRALRGQSSGLIMFGSTLFLMWPARPAEAGPAARPGRKTGGARIVPLR